MLLGAKCFISFLFSRDYTLLSCSRVAVLCLQNCTFIILPRTPGGNFSKRRSSRDVGFFRKPRRASIGAAEITFGLSYGDFGLRISNITRTIFLAATALREMIYNVDTGVRVKLPTRHYILFYAARVAGANPIFRLISVRGSKMFKSEKT